MIEYFMFLLEFYFNSSFLYMELLYSSSNLDINDNSYRFKLNVHLVTLLVLFECLFFNKINYILKHNIIHKTKSKIIQL